jgi:hypothetical protein
LSAPRDAAQRRGPTAVLSAAILVLAGCGDDPVSAGLRCGIAAEVTEGAPVTGVLESGDARFAGAYMDYYTLRIATADTVTVGLVSEEFDPFIFLFDELGGVVEHALSPEDQPAGEPETARITRLLEPGCYTVGATTWDRAGTGIYRVSVEAPPS